MSLLRILLNKYNTYINLITRYTNDLSITFLLKRIINPYGGVRMVQSSLDAYGYKLDETINKHFVRLYIKKEDSEGVEKEELL